MPAKFNMWTSGFCAFCCLYHIIEGNVAYAAITGLLAMTNLILGVRNND